MKYGYVVFALLLVLQAAGWILEKKGITQVTSGNTNINFDAVKRIVTNPYLIAGVFCVGVGFICWLYLLTQFNLTYIYPFGSLLYVIVTILAYFFLGEAISVTRMVGIAVIVIGCIMVNWR